MADASGTTVCPFCKETIKEGAVKCRYCGSRIAETAPDHQGVCPFCKEDIKPDAVKCRYCGSNLVVAADAAGGGGDCGCGGGGGHATSGYQQPRVQRRFAADPASDWWDCVQYCFLDTIGEGQGAWDMCVKYRCGDYPTGTPIRFPRFMTR